MTYDIVQDNFFTRVFEEINMLKTLKFFVISFFCLVSIASGGDTKIKDIEKIRKAIVTINSRVPVSAYQNTGSWSGTGFIVDGKKGYLVTNNHVIGRASVGTYFITFYNGQQAEAKVIYYDQYADFAIMQMDPKELPAEFEVVEFTNAVPELGSNVFIVGNTEGQGFSFHDGYLSDLYEINGDMPQGSYVINLNSTGGASGSPIFNLNNQAIGILYGGGKTHSLGLKAEYITHILKNLEAGESPNRKHIGVITDLYSLDKAVKHRHFSATDMNNYIKEFPNARNRAIIVRKVLPGSVAEGEILPSDILWQVEDKKIGADLCLLDMALSRATNKIKITVIRDGKKIDKELIPYDLEKNKISKILDFAGGLFFEADDYVAAKSGIPIGSVALANVQTGSGFSSIPEMFVQDYKSVYRIQMKSINGKKINTLADLTSAVSMCIDQKYINMEYVNFQPYYPYYASANGGFISAHENLMQDITFDSIDTKPRILRYDPKLSEWVSENL